MTDDIKHMPTERLLQTKYEPHLEAHATPSTPLAKDPRGEFCDATRLTESSSGFETSGAHFLGPGTGLMRLSIFANKIPSLRDSLARG